MLRSDELGTDGHIHIEAKQLYVQVKSKFRTYLPNDQVKIVLKVEIELLLQVLGSLGVKKQYKLTYEFLEIKLLLNLNYV